MPKSIFLIDDDVDDRLLFSEAVASVDPSVIFSCAEDAETGLSMLTNGTVVMPDVIFLDINLPLLSGWTCLVGIKKNPQLRNIEVIMYSTSTNQRDRDLAAELGALCFISKPYDFRVLQKILTIVVKSLYRIEKQVNLREEIDAFLLK